METYKKIQGYENYSVSDFGNVRNDKTGRIKTAGANKNGYIRVDLTKDGITKHIHTHQLVALTFIPNLENKPHVDHIDNNRINNNITNLRWATRSENNQNASIRSNNKSGSKGVSWSKKTQKWSANISINGKQINLGSFINKDDAINIRVQRAKDVFGEYINKCELVIT